MHKNITISTQGKSNVLLCSMAVNVFATLGRNNPIIETNLSPNALLGACLGIESAMGRLRPFKNSPRIIDIDVLLYEDVEIDTKELKIPYPFIRERPFVLVPMHDIIYNNKFFSYDISDSYEKCDKSQIIKRI